jgi:hypothetical protein
MQPDDLHPRLGGPARTFLSQKHQLSVLLPQPTELLTLNAGQTVFALAFVAVGLCHPVADRLGRRLKFPRQLLRLRPARTGATICSQNSGG